MNTPEQPDQTVPGPDALQRFARSWASAVLTLALGVVLLILLPRVLDDFALVQATVYVVMSILAVSLGFIWGFGGILCFGQSAFFGLGAYAYAIAVTNLGDSTLPFLLAIVLPAAFAGVLGYLLFDEIPRAIFYVASAIVVAGVVTVVRAAPAPEESPA